MDYTRKICVSIKYLPQHRDAIYIRGYSKILLKKLRNSNPKAWPGGCRIPKLVEEYCEYIGDVFRGGAI